MHPAPYLKSYLQADDEDQYEEDAFDNQVIDDGDEEEEGVDTGDQEGNDKYEDNEDYVQNNAQQQQFDRV